MEPETYLRHLRDAGEGIARAAEAPGADLTAPVPSCPDYDVAALLVHTGFVLRWISACAESGEMAPRPSSDEAAADPLTWYRDGLTRALDVLGSVDRDAPGWSWGSDQSRGFWIRRAALELAVHAWDARNALGEAPPVDPALAADGIDELFTEFVPRRGLAGRFEGEGQTMHLHATDAPAGTNGEWLVRLAPAAFEVTHEHAKGDAAARGTASDLFLFLWGRVPPAALEVFGDASLLERWRERCSI